MDRRHPIELVRHALLVIAGSDSSAGSGLQRDLRVLADHMYPARVAVTAVTAQCQLRVRAVHHLPPELIREQILAASSDVRLSAVKIGMLGNRAAVRAVADALAELPHLPIVLDPVLAASSGVSLMAEGGQDAMLEHLCPLITLLTPNLAEAAQLLDAPLAKSGAEAAAQATRMGEVLGCPVLLKGGHAGGSTAIDYLAEGGEVIALEGERVSATLRGSGCALSTAIAL